MARMGFEVELDALGTPQVFEQPEAHRVLVTGASGILGQGVARALLASGGAATLSRTLSRLAPVSLSALLLTLVLLFGLQGEQIVQQPAVIALLAVPILIQVYFNAGLAYWLSRRFGVAWCVAAPAALIGASNFFELAVAAAIALFGFQSGAALATEAGGGESGGEGAGGAARRRMVRIRSASSRGSKGLGR